MKIDENCIEWIRGQDTATVTLSSSRHIARLFKLMEDHPEDVKVMAENDDGSYVFHVPVSYIKFNPPKTLTEEQRNALVERIQKINGCNTEPKG